MSMSLLELVEAAGYNPRDHDDAIRLTAILNNEDIANLCDIIDNTIELDYNRQRVEELTEQLGGLIPSGQAGSDYQILKREIEGYQQTIDDLIKEGEEL